MSYTLHALRSPLKMALFRNFSFFQPSLNFPSNPITSFTFNICVYLRNLRIRSKWLCFAISPFSGQPQSSPRPQRKVWITLTTEAQRHGASATEHAEFTEGDGDRPSGVQLLQTGDGKLAKGGFPVPGFNICRAAIRHALRPRSSRLISVLSVPSVAKLRIFSASLCDLRGEPIGPICRFYTGVSAECKSNRNRSWPQRAQSPQSFVLSLELDTD